MFDIDSTTKIIIQDRGISAIHPMILHKTNNSVIICSVASYEGNSSFDYSIIFDRDQLAFDKSDSELVDIICQTDHYKESKWGHDLVIFHGIKQEWIDTAKLYINIQNPKLIRLSKDTRDGGK